MQAYRISGVERALFKRCRRAWDLGAGPRRGLEPIDSPADSRLDDALLGALDVYYYPGMWSWSREIVLPLVHQALDQALDRSGCDTPALARHDLIDHYASWAPSVDRFIPVEVAADIEVNVPDPILSHRGLATVAGQPVRFVTRLDGLVFGEDHRPWLLCHRLERGPFIDPDTLAFDEAALADCWAWQEFSPDARLAGVIFNEVRLDSDDRFRRTTVPVTAGEITLVGRHLAHEAFDMLDAGLALYPNLSPQHCGSCPFRAPCRAIQQGDDPGPILVAAYRRRPDTPLEEGRLGGRVWSMSRGARPPHFGRAADDVGRLHDR